MITAYLLLGGGLIALGGFLLFTIHLNLSARHEWHFTFRFSPRRAADGSIVNYGPCMRRKINGRWQYREMTPAEESDWVASEAW